MKLVAISRVMNEADIIEPFVRHHACDFDKLIVLDGGSVDGTYELLRSLQAEGLPLVVMRAEAAIRCEQTPSMTRLLRIAIDRFGADWVVPLDAHEFTELNAGTRLAQVLDRHGQELLKVGWSNFVWIREEEQNAELNPVLRLRVRTLRRTEPAKVLIPARLATAETAQLTEGNHNLTINGQQVPADLLHEVTLCRFPIRTPMQYASKVAVGYLQHCAAPRGGRSDGSGHREVFRLLSGGIDQLIEAMPGHSRQCGPLEQAPPSDRLEEAPLRYAGGPLKFTRKRDAMLTNVLLCAEAIANRLAELGREREELVRALCAATPDLDDAVPLWRISVLHSRAEQKLAVAAKLERANGDRAALMRRVEDLDAELVDMRERMFEQANELASRAFSLARRLRRLHALVRSPIRATGKLFPR